MRRLISVEIFPIFAQLYENLSLTAEATCKVVLGPFKLGHMICGSIVTVHVLKMFLPCLFIA